MKTALIILSVALLATDAAAFLGVTQRGYKKGGPVKRINDGGASEVKRKEMAEKKTCAKAKGIAMTKIEIPDGGTYHGLHIDNSARILSLCGFEIGEIAKVPRRPVLDKDGNIVMTGKLAKPFRKCTQYELTYSKVNHALYSIRIFSPAQKKMDDEAAAAELEAMTDAVKAKFGDKIASIIRGPSTHSLNLKLFSHQSMSVNSYKANIDKKGRLKGSVDAREETGWAFSVFLTDRAMHDYVPAAPTPEGKSAEGVDAL